MPTREWSPLTTHWSVTSDSSPRTSPVDSIGEHHAAATSRDLCLALFQPGGRTVSPNYLIYRREIWGIVPESQRAWTSSDAWADSRSITKEIVNETGSPAYSFHPETLESIMRLDADIARFYGIPFRHAIAGFWEHRNLYEWYGRSYATACAGPSFDINAIIAGAAAGGAVTPPRRPKESEMTAIFIASSASADGLIPAGTIYIQEGGIGALRRIDNRDEYGVYVFYATAPNLTDAQRVPFRKVEWSGEQIRGYVRSVGLYEITNVAPNPYQPTGRIIYTDPMKPVTPPSLASVQLTDAQLATIAAAVAAATPSPQVIAEAVVDEQHSRLAE